MVNGIAADLIGGPSRRQLKSRPAEGRDDLLLAKDDHTLEAQRRLGPDDRVECAAEPPAFGGGERAFS